MVMSLIVIKKIIEMFMILLVGVIIYKGKIIDDASTKHLSNVLLLLVSPLLIIQSYQIDFNKKLLYGLLWAFVASFLTFLLMIIASEFLFRGDRNRSSVEKIAMSYSNSGFIGIPLISGVLGDKGVFYMTAYITVFNVLLWTHGVILMGDSDGLKGAWKNFLTPAIISIVIGIILFLFRLRLPQFIENPLEMIASMNTPLGMIVAGANLAQGNILKSLKNKRFYYLSFIKLMLYPLAALVVLWLLPLDFEVAFTVFIAVACPAGASVIMFAQRYDRDAYYASEIFVITTLLSAITLPLLSIIAIGVLK